MAVNKNPGQWEVVGGKPAKGKAKSTPVNGKQGSSSKGAAANMPTIKVDELVSPLDTRFALLDPQLRAQAKRDALGIAEKPAEKPKSKAPQPVKEAPKKKPNPKETPKDKGPKTLPDAIKQLDIEEFKQLKETVKARFTGTPLFWLRELTSYLNHNLNSDADPTFSGKPRDYPSSLLTSEFRGIITSTFSECGDDTLQSFYEQSLLTIPSEINRGSKVMGTKLMLQLLSFHKPSLALNNLARFKEALSTQESRVPVSLSLLWVLSQSAVKDTSIGIKVWFDAMLPLINLKNYAPFVGQVASQLTLKAKDIKSTKEIVSASDYFNLFDLVQESSLPANIRKDLQSLVIALTRPMMASSGPKMFSILLQRLPNAGAGHSPEICRHLIDCLKTDSRTFETWRKEYKSHLSASAALLKWTNLHETNFVRKSEEFRSTLFHFRNVNNSYASSAKRPEALKSCIGHTESLIADMSRPKKPKAKRSFKYLNYLLLISLVGLIYYDVRVHGDGVWTQSRLGRTMDRFGVNDRVVQVYQRCEPYVQLAKEKSQPLVDNAVLYAIQLKDLIHQKGEHYFPGIWDEADKKYQVAVAFLKEKSDVLLENATRYADVCKEIGAQYWQKASQKGGEYWNIAAEKGTQYGQVASERIAEYWQIFSQYSAVYWEKVRVLSAKLMKEERVQQAWKYTYDMYTWAMHAVGLCTH